MTSLSTERLRSALADRYRIERELGQGGMATVYLALDLKHDRNVALKVLKPELAAVLGAERFVVEIKTTAALQHPHILPLFDSGTADGFLYYVMPFIDGETLRTRLDRETQLPVDEAVQLTRNIAEALHYAHTHGVIHRDIKPENILLQDGRPMVADFGIALAVSAAAGGRMTETGLSLGTPHYMSPEQATAEKDITARSDVYSLASVLYEMLTGNPPHVGASAQQIIMKIITEAPASATTLRKSVPSYVSDAIDRALEKLPADRFISAAAFAAALAGHGDARTLGGVSSRSPRAASTGARWKQVAIGASLAAVLATTAAVWSFGQRATLENAASPIEFAYRPILSSTQRPFVDISPSGQRILQSAADSNGVIQLTVRDLGSSVQRLIPGAEGALDAVLSPDGEWALYGRQSKLHRISINGGPSTLLVDSINGPADWANDGFVYYTRHDAGLWRIPDVGGVAQQLTSLDTSGVEFNHWLPQLLPGGRAVLFNSYTTPISKSRIEAVDIASGVRTVLAEGAVHARYAASGHLLFARDGAIFAAPFDASALKLRGPAVPVIEGVAWTVTDGVAGYDVAENGTLIYVADSAWRMQKRVAFVDRAGIESVAIPEAGDWFEPRLSPDERWIAATRVTKFAHIWLYDRSRGVLSEFSRGEGATLNALWTPDSRTLLHTREVPVYDIYRQDIDGSPPVPVVTSRSDKQASSISPDGRLVSYTESITNDAVLLAPFAGGASKRLAPGDAEQRNGSFSPDGKWFAYEEFLPERRSEVYARRLDSDVGRVLVSAGGGTQPRFTRGGREIVYRRGDAMLAASFDPVAGEAGIPTELFRKTAAGRLNGERTVGYDVTADGSKFLLVIPVPRPAALPNIVVTNWFDELSRKAPR